MGHSHSQPPEQTEKKPGAPGAAPADANRRHEQLRQDNPGRLQPGQGDAGRRQQNDGRKHQDKS